MVPASRSNEVDIIRVVALVGICVVNVPFFALPEIFMFVPADQWHNRAASFFVECFFSLKFFTLFSFVFGWGMSLQANIAHAKGASAKNRYFKRLAGLAIIGVAHVVLVFSGDILLLYALVGAALWLVKDYTVANLLKVAWAFLGLSMLGFITTALLLDGMLVDSTATRSSATVGLGGSYIENLQTRIQDWPWSFGFILLLQGPMTCAAYTAGMAASKSGFFKPDNAGFARFERAIPLCLIIGLPVNLLFATVVSGFVPDSYALLHLVGFVLPAIGAPALTAVYLYTVVLVARKYPMPTLLTLAGRNSLSCYVMQGVLAGLVFGGYGLGLFNHLGQLALLPVSVVIATVSIVVTAAYANKFGRGPLEPLLRWFTK